MATLNKDLVLLTAKSKLEKDGFEITDKELQNEVVKLSTNMDFLEAVDIVYAKLKAGVEEEKVYKSFIVNWGQELVMANHPNKGGLHYYQELPSNAARHPSH